MHERKRTCTEKTKGKIVPTATMAMLVSKEKSRMPFAHMNVAKHVRHTINKVCHVSANLMPSKKSTRYSRKIDHALSSLSEFPPPIVIQEMRLAPQPVSNPRIFK
jgi:hypothetical protein